MYEFDEKFVQKVASLREEGVNPWPNGLLVTHTSTALHQRFGAEADPAASAAGESFAVGGRVMYRNRMGKAMFLRLQDRGEPASVIGVDGQPYPTTGVLQVYVRQGEGEGEVSAEVFEQLKKLDIGDFLWAKGRMMRTKTGELSLQASQARLASKVMTPFPDRWHSVTDVQTRARQRYVDLFMNADTRDVFRKRSRVVRYIRDFFEARDYLEVETPIMHVIPGGATARPFITHHNTLGMDLYLRVAPELYLKRLVVGGLERVFEINRSFRNEGVSVKHNPEFTMLEFYEAWATCDDLIALTERLLAGLATDVIGSAKVIFAEREIDFTPPFRKADMDALIAEYTSLSLADLQDVSAMAAWWTKHHRVADPNKLPNSVGRWWELIFGEHVEHELVNPTFVTGFPAEISPLARRRDDDPFRVDRFELIVNGWELANGFSELNDPVDQAERFAAQAKGREAGDEEAMHFNADYIRALTYAMPPTAGQGIGIDRLVMLLTGRPSIREVILFPTLRPESGRAEGEGDEPS